MENTPPHIYHQLIEFTKLKATEPVSKDHVCHKDLCSPAECSRCGPILEARKLLNEIEGSQIYRTRF